MIFIQLGHLRLASHIPNNVFINASESLKQLFRRHEESAFLFWHEIPIRFRYQQDIPRNFDQILALVWLMQRDDEGASEIELVTQLVSMRWQILWTKDRATITADFKPEMPEYQPYIESLNQHSEISLPKEELINELAMLLRQVAICLKTAKVQIQNGTERRKQELLERVVENILMPGKMYKKEN